jgi:hypothetical protein
VKTCTNNTDCNGMDMCRPIAFSDGGLTGFSNCLPQ